MALARFILFLAVCNWHVPAAMPHLYVICRPLSATRMQAFYPGSISLMCVAFADPTFGKELKSLRHRHPKDPNVVGVLQSTRRFLQLICYRLMLPLQN